MALETYDLCPGGTGKKIKFCGCKDIVHSLDKVLTAIQGDQRAAAIAQLDRLQQSHPNRACVLALKASCLFRANEFEAAEPTVATFISQYPDNPLALTDSAILHAIDGDLDNAVTKLQRALENSGDSQIDSIGEAFGVIGRLFVQQGKILAGRAHLIAHAGFSDRDDVRSLTLLMRLHALPEVPVLLKDDLKIDDRPQDVAWGEDYDEAVRLSRQGIWLAAVEKLVELSQQYPSEPALLKGIAVINGWLGRSEQAVAAWRRYAALDGISLDDAVEAEATAQLLGKTRDEDMVDLVKITYPVLDMDSLLERLAADRHFERLGADPAQFVEEGQPPPKSVYLWLDRPEVTSAETVTRDQVPRVNGELAIFGRETDREPRLELMVTKGESFDEELGSLKQHLEGLLNWDGEETLQNRTTRSSEFARPTFRFPANLDFEQRREIVSEEYRDIYFNQWPAMKQGVFDGKAAQDICNDPEYRIRLLAAILLVELRTSPAPIQPLDFNELRENLGLPKREKIDPWTMSDVSRCPLVRIPLLDVLKLSDDDLVELYLRAGRLGAAEATLHVAEEIERRPSLDKKVDKVELYESLAELTKDDQKALDYIQKAREIAVATGASPARWLLAELEMRFQRGQPEGVEELLETIQRKYIREPGVGEELVQILVKFGLLNPDGTPTQVPQQQATAATAQPAADQGSGLWTPESDAGKSGGSEEAGKSKLWLPGMD